MAAQEQKTVAFVLYPGLTLLDLVGPLQVFASLRRFNDQYRPVVVAERIEPMPTDGPLIVTADQTFAAVPDPTVVIVPGGDAPTIKAMGNPTIREYLRHAAQSAPVVGSVCTGALVLAAAGLLEGRQATTHWAYHRLLERLGATYVRQRWVEDGKFITSAGVSAGIDMALALVARLTDKATARMVQLAIEYDPHPPFGGIDWRQVDRDIYEPMLGPMVQQQLADRPELLTKLRGASSGRVAGRALPWDRPWYGAVLPGPRRWRRRLDDSVGSFVGESGVAAARARAPFAARAACAARTGSCLAACTPPVSWPQPTAAGRHRRGAREMGSSAHRDRHWMMSSLPRWLPGS
jgi:putative intracellular protease/amidase